MNFNEIHTRINLIEYNAIVSIGNKCPTAMILRELSLYRESFPFDYVPTTPALILKYFKDPVEFYPGKGQIVTQDGLWFGHFDLHLNYDLTMEAFNRRFCRLFNLLQKKKKIIFVYTSEADIYNEMGNRYNDNYGDLLKIRDYIIERYQYTDFLILAVHTNKVYDMIDSNIVNYTINVDKSYMSNNKETNCPETWNPYRSVLKTLFSKIFLNPL